MFYQITSSIPVNNECNSSPSISSGYEYGPLDQNSGVCKIESSVTTSATNENVHTVSTFSNRYTTIEGFKEGAGTTGGVGTGSDDKMKSHKFPLIKRICSEQIK